MLKIFELAISFAVILLCVINCSCGSDQGSKPIGDSLYCAVFNAVLANISERLKRFEEKQTEVASQIARMSEDVKDIKNRIHSATNSNLENHVSAEKKQHVDINSSETATAVEWNCSASHSEIIYKNCEEALQNERPNGVYTICDRSYHLPPFKVFCLKATSGEKPWTIIQRRQSNSSEFIDFKRGWEDYKHGFGDPEHDHWLGLEKISALTKVGYHDLFTSVESTGTSSSGVVDGFHIGNETENFAQKQPEELLPFCGTFCFQIPFATIDRGAIMLAVVNGGGGFWLDPVKKQINYNGQKYVNGKPSIHIEGSSNVSYVHMAIRDNTEHLQKIVEDVKNMTTF